MARIVVCPVEDLPPGSSKTIHTDIGMVGVFNVDGTLHAIDDLCPHMSESLAQGHLDGCIVTCGLHGWRFDVRSGKSPDFAGVEVATFTVFEADGQVVLDIAGAGLVPDDGVDWEGSTDPDDIEEPLFD